MATTKKIDGDYNIQSVDATTSNVNITTHTVNITGNLDVAGNVTYIDTEELFVEDPFITVAANNTGVLANAIHQEQGLVTQTSANTYAGLRFDNPTEEWQVSPSVEANGAPITAYTAISVGPHTTPGSVDTTIQYNESGAFNGNINLTYDYANSKLTLNGYQVYANIGSSPGATANSVAVYHNPTGGGGTGLYVKSATVDDELVSKSKAIVYGIIF